MNGHGRFPVISGGKLKISSSCTILFLGVDTDLIEKEVLDGFLRDIPQQFAVGVVEEYPKSTLKAPLSARLPRRILHNEDLYPRSSLIKRSVLQLLVIAASHR